MATIREPAGTATPDAAFVIAKVRTLPAATLALVRAPRDTGTKAVQFPLATVVARDATEDEPPPAPSRLASARVALLVLSAERPADGTNQAPTMTPVRLMRAKAVSAVAVPAAPSAATLRYCACLSAATLRSSTLPTPTRTQTPAESICKTCPAMLRAPALLVSATVWSSTR